MEITEEIALARIEHLETEERETKREQEQQRNQGGRRGP